MILILTQVMLVNMGNQYLGWYFQDPIAIDICDHADSEKECDKKESGEKDDLISHVSITPTMDLIEFSVRRMATAKGYNSKHLEIVSPPPEYLL